ncbi:MAG TPA: UDP-N-acetylglucosamine 2-epimerase (non-hydrolyzing) [Blastocatellia bacterium]|nr:UDP-N-acetylglucosamine 2-epimerase (non-hydrolyzing) [Blastocatellia bacterium]
MARIRVASIMGTRPEVIKLAPVVKELGRRSGSFEQTVVATAQHREMLDQVLSTFAISPDIDLNLMEPDQGLAAFASRSLVAVSQLLESLKPNLVLIQGDTTTVMSAALAAFYHGISVGHVEAGLRSYDKRNPFPEEINRRVASCLVDIHFAPTELARRNLAREGVSDRDIHVTGNTVVDALGSVHIEGPFEDDELNGIDFGARRILLVTAHRRENHGEPLRAICRALKAVAESNEDVGVVYPVHLNPKVGEMVAAELSGIRNVHLVRPLSYRDLLRLMARCYLILTDSGGIQEEAPSFRKPVLVLREVTERPELIEAGGGKLVGTNSVRIVEETLHLLRDLGDYNKMSRVDNPFGDGHAAERIADALEKRFLTA